MVSNLKCKKTLWGLVKYKLLSHTRSHGIRNFEFETTFAADPGAGFPEAAVKTLGAEMATCPRVEGQEVTLSDNWGASCLQNTADPTEVCVL